MMRAFVDEYAREQPLSFAASVRKSLRLRAQLVAASNRTLLAARRGVALRSPLLHPDFVDAIARAGGVLGSGHRTRVLDELVPDLLPATVRARTSKAAFDSCYLNRHAREFAAGWSGDGLDRELVDPDELRRRWAAGTAPVSTGPLLQAAWLAEQAATSRSATRSSRP
jgi:asparagine synthase (glutamine-hydrolysing)